MINNTVSSCEHCMKLIRGIVLKGLEWNFRIFARHLKSEENQAADALSRLQFRKFKVLARELHLRVVPEPLPMELWPVNKIWDVTGFP